MNGLALSQTMMLDSIIIAETLISIKQNHLIHGFIFSFITKEKKNILTLKCQGIACICENFFLRLILKRHIIWILKRLNIVGCLNTGCLMSYSRKGFQAYFFIVHLEGEKCSTSQLLQLTQVDSIARSRIQLLFIVCNKVQEEDEIPSGN